MRFWNLLYRVHVPHRHQSCYFRVRGMPLCLSQILPAVQQPYNELRPRWLLAGLRLGGRRINCASYLDIFPRHKLQDNGSLSSRAICAVGDFGGNSANIFAWKFHHSLAEKGALRDYDPLVRGIPGGAAQVVRGAAEHDIE